MGNKLFRPLNDIIAQSCRNTISRSCHYGKPDVKKFLCTIINQFQENEKEKIKIAKLRSKECSDRKFYKMENIGHPQMMLGG